MMSQTLINSYTQYIAEASENFLTNKPYSYSSEFINRRLWSGTVMPLTAACADLSCIYTLRKASSRWADYGVSVESKYALTGLGNAIYDINESNGFERSRLDGTLAMWILRRNERKRQLQKINNLYDSTEISVLRHTYQSFREQSLELFREFFHTINVYLTEILSKPKKAHEILENSISTYISQQHKRNVSLIPRVGMGYEDLLKEDLIRIAKHEIRFNNLIIDNLYSNKRVDPMYILSALRNRPADIIDEILMSGEKSLRIDRTKAFLYSERSREANGQPPESHAWMWIYLIKKHVSHWLIEELRKLYEINFKTPVELGLQFYRDLCHKRNGLYLFGDNGMLIQGDKEYIYDLSISDVFQGAIRRSMDGKNLCFFQRLDSRYDCGSTGDCLTSYWNLEGQLIIWRAWKDGSLSGDLGPRIPDLIEDSSTFLGHWFHDGKVSSMGLRLTRDDATKSKPVYIKPSRRATINWPKRTTIKRNELIQAAIAAGVTKMDLRQFYDWASKETEGLTEDPLVEHLSPYDRIKRISEISPKFKTLIPQDELEVLAAPLIIV